MKSVFSLTIFFLIEFSYGQAYVQWVQNTTGVSIATDAMNNVYTVYYVYNPGGDIFLTKRNTDGNFIWEATYDQTDNSKWEKATWVATDNQGNVLVSGTVMSGFSNPVEAASIIMKFDTNGNLLWRNVYESSFDGSYTTKCLIDNSDNVYVLGMGPGTPNYTLKVKKFAPDGSAVWTYFDANGIGKPINFKFTPDNMIVITGRSIFGSINGYAKIDLNGNHIWSYPGVYSLTVGDSDGDDFGNTYLVHREYVTNGGTELKKISPVGSLLWSNIYQNIAGFRVEVGSDNHPVVCGFPNFNTTGSTFLKVDGSGNIVWFNPDADSTFALLLHAKLIMDHNDNIYLAAGTLTEMAVCKVNNNGSSAWTITMPGGYARDIVLGADNNVYVVGGNTAKINQSPVTVINELDFATSGFTLEQNYPNPFNPSTKLSFFIGQQSFVTLKVFDILGKEVVTLVDEELQAGKYETDFSAHSVKGQNMPAGRQGLPSGVYFYQLRISSPVQKDSFEEINFPNGQAGQEIIQTKKMILLR